MLLSQWFGRASLENKRSTEAINFWQRMAKAGGAKPPAFLSTHPTDEKRIAKIKQWIQMRSDIIGRKRDMNSFF